MNVIVSTAYLPPISFFKIAKRCKNITIEACETYVKQTYRNRCEILTANGVLPLSIPVIKINGNGTQIKDIKIDNSTKWRKEHWRAIESAYRSSAFFELIADYFTPYYSKPWEFLWDYNLSIIYTIIEILELDVYIDETTQFKREYPEALDYRNTINPKNKISIYDDNKEYYQVFASKFGFAPHLSIFDLLSNCGMESILYL